MSTSTPRKDVEIEGRFVQLEVGPYGQKEESNRFYVGLWDWQISVLRARKRTWVTLSPCSKMDRITASVCLRLTFFPKSGPAVICNIPEVEASLNHNYAWNLIDRCVSRSCLVEIEFVGINWFGTTEPALPSAEMQATSREQAQSGVARMLREGILTDITVNAVGGSIGAHRAVLAARSPVFRSMFSHDLREKELSAVDISDMSIAACRAFVGYLYGAAPSEEELLAHRSELVAAGDKYCVANLKETCEESLRTDVGAGNVLERLQMAHVYGLPALKRTCVRLLVDFGKMYEIPEDFVEFTMAGDPELVREIKRFAVSRGRKLPAARESAAGKPSTKKAPAKRARKPTPSKASGSIPAKRARRANVRLAGDEWALPASGAR